MKTRNLLLIVFFALISGYILRTITHPCLEPIMDTDTIYVHSVSYDTIIQERPVEVLKYVPKEVQTTVYQPVKIPVDTAAIIRDYFSVRYYDDILKDDSTGYVRLKEKVYQSKILDRELYFEARCTDKIITNTIYPSGLYLSGSLTFSRDFVYPSIGLSYIRPKSLYFGSVGYWDSPVFSVGYGIKF